MSLRICRGSHLLCEPPPRDWNPGAYEADADSTAGRAATPFFPATPPEARHMTAPAGSILMYHSGTWHRISANLSPSPRIGIAQSFVPDFIVEASCPGGPRQPNGGRLCSAERIALRGYLAAKQPEDSAEHSRFRGCAEAALLTPREADDLERLWVGTERCERAMLFAVVWCAVGVSQALLAVRRRVAGAGRVGDGSLHSFRRGKRGPV